MNSGNLFNLEPAIQRWRRRMIAAGIRSPDILDELENHLRENVERQMNSGLDAAQAFERSLQCLGQAADLKNEFALVPGEPDLLKREFKKNCQTSTKNLSTRVFTVLAALLLIVIGMTAILPPLVESHSQTGEWTRDDTIWFLIGIILCLSGAGAAPVSFGNSKSIRGRRLVGALLALGGGLVVFWDGFILLGLLQAFWTNRPPPMLIPSIIGISVFTTIVVSLCTSIVILSNQRRLHANDSQKARYV